MHHPIRRVRPAAAVVLAATASVLLAPSTVTAGKPDLDALTARRKRLERRVEQALVELEHLEATRDATRDQLDRAARQQRRTRTQLSRAHAQLRRQVRQQYMHRSTLDLTGLLASTGPADAVERTAMLSTVTRDDLQTIETTRALEQQLAATTRLLEQRRTELDDVEATMRDRTTGLQATLDKTARKERFLRAATTAARSVSDGPMKGNYACLFDKGAYHFIDSWGFARSGGRSHEGTDVMAARGVNVYAFTNGTISDLSSNGLGGITLHISGDDGHRYYYAHLQGYADTITSGTRVNAGDLVGYNGDSGNARGGPTHVHFEVHPDQGAPTNPYPWLRAVCP